MDDLKSLAQNFEGLHRGMDAVTGAVLPLQKYYRHGHGGQNREQPISREYEELES